MKLLHFLLVITLTGATASLAADTSNVVDLKQAQQTLTAAANQTVTNASIATMSNIPAKLPLAIDNDQPALIEYRGASTDTEICRERLDHTVINRADTPTATAATPIIPATDPVAAPVVVSSDLTQDELAGADLDEADFVINPDIISPGFQVEPSLTDKIKWAFAFLRMKMNLACDATGTAMSNGYDTITIHLSKHQKAYIIGTVCVGGVLLGVWLFKTRK